MGHRRDIDGLRAVAVLSVVFYHYREMLWPRVSGGFVGVDVFFVISGYLITGLLQGEIASTGFRISEFYHRRVRRIFPALFLVHVATLGASALLLFATEVKDVGRDVRSSLAFVSNVAFYRASGYFDQRAKMAPLLHTWSLSVEEQFYILLPLLLLALRRVSGRARIAVVLALTVASFAAAERMVGRDAPRAFYLVHYRAWELLVGALLALGALPRLRARALAEAAGGLGLALVLYAVFAIDETTPFPGRWALPACAGTLAILWSGVDGRTLTSRLLGVAPLRLVGEVSYSFYLWHWPPLVLLQVRKPTPGLQDGVLLLAVTFGVSVLSHRYVEQPFRVKPFRLAARQALGLGALGMASVAALSVGIPYASAKLRPEERLAGDVLTYLTYSPKRETRSGKCFLSSGSRDGEAYDESECLAVRSDRRNFLLIGDSHAAQFYGGLRAVRPDINFLQATASGCMAIHRDRGAKRCTEVLSYAFDVFLPAHHVDAIVIAGRWLSHHLRGVKKTVEYVRPFADRVIVLGPIVEYDEPLPRLLARSITEHDRALPSRHRKPAPARFDREFAAGLRGSGAEYYSVHEAMCQRGRCTEWATDGVPMQFDYGHLTLAGATVLVGRFGSAFFR